MTVRKKYNCLSHDKFISGDYSLAVVQSEDIEDIRKWRNAQMQVLRQNVPIEPDQQTKYFSSMVWPSMALPEPDNILLTFFYREKRIGYGGLVHISWQDKRAEMSFLLSTEYISDDNEYERYFSIFIELLLKISFDHMAFHRVFTETYSIRKHHIVVLEKAGFTLEGTMRDHVKLEGNFVDSLLHGVLNGNDPDE